MLTKKAIRDFREIQRLGLNFRVSAVFWQTKYQSSRAKKTIYLGILSAGVLYYTGDVCYLTLTLYHLFMDSTISLDVLVKIGIHWLSRLVTLLFQYHAILYRQELEAYCAQVFHLHRKMQSKFKRKRQLKA